MEEKRCEKKIWQVRCAWGVLQMPKKEPFISVVLLDLADFKITYPISGQQMAKFAGGEMLFLVSLLVSYRVHQLAI